jgi:hypothetical protein
VQLEAAHHGWAERASRCEAAWEAAHHGPAGEEQQLQQSEPELGLAEHDWVQGWQQDVGRSLIPLGLVQCLGAGNLQTRAPHEWAWKEERSCQRTRAKRRQG